MHSFVGMRLHDGRMPPAYSIIFIPHPVQEGFTHTHDEVSNVMKFTCTNQDSKFQINHKSQVIHDMTMIEVKIQGGSRLGRLPYTCADCKLEEIKESKP